MLPEIEHQQLLTVSGGCTSIFEIPPKEWTEEWVELNGNNIPWIPFWADYSSRKMWFNASFYVFD